ncbi:unnamed protein product [Staurois parvus]|uniref:Uncharacterized protein n=1 Tax=Staurois parvus TaxID=386267 RepID=A0ABN9HPH9_9NEOB|nr:unnamed protein product [Staurois parvus]
MGIGHIQVWTDNSWGLRAIGDHGAPVSLPKLKKAYEKGTRGISWGPLLTPGPRAMLEFPNGQSAPGHITTVTDGKLTFKYQTSDIM